MTAPDHIHSPAPTQPQTHHTLPQKPHSACPSTPPPPPPAAISQQAVGRAVYTQLLSCLHLMSIPFCCVIEWLLFKNRRTFEGEAPLAVTLLSWEGVARGCGTVGACGGAVAWGAVASGELGLRLCEGGGGGIYFFLFYLHESLLVDTCFVGTRVSLGSSLSPFLWAERERAVILRSLYCTGGGSKRVREECGGPEMTIPGASATHPSSWRRRRRGGWSSFITQRVLVIQNIMICAVPCEISHQECCGCCYRRSVTFVCLFTCLTRLSFGRPLVDSE